MGLRLRECPGGPHPAGGRRGRLFVASDNGAVYALDPATGCTYWMFQAAAGVPTALSVAPYHAASGTSGYAVLFGDRQANAYAVDAQTGMQVWRTKLDTHPSAAVTGAPAPYNGRVYVPIQGVGEEGQGIHAKNGCCTFRGSVSALDIDTGKVLWKTYTVPEEPKPRGKSTTGMPMFGHQVSVSGPRRPSMSNANSCMCPPATPTPIRRSTTAMRCSPWTSPRARSNG